jgi:F-actin capping protein, beta subunit
MSEKSQIESAVSLFTRLPPSKVKQSLAAISTLQPDLQDDLLQKIDQPFGTYMKTINSPQRDRNGH